MDDDPDVLLFLVGEALVESLNLAFHFGSFVFGPLSLSGRHLFRIPRREIESLQASSGGEMESITSETHCLISAGKSNSTASIFAEHYPKVFQRLLPPTIPRSADHKLISRVQ